MLQVESSLDAADCARATDEILASPEKLGFVQGLVAGGPPIGLLRAGFDNDLRQFGAIGRLPLREIRCPTLVMHGTHDGDVPFAHGERSVREIPGVELHRVEKGWHLLALSEGAEDCERAKMSFYCGTCSRSGQRSGGGCGWWPQRDSNPCYQLERLAS